MKEFNENYLSTYRYGVRLMNEESPLASMLLQLGLTSLFFVPLTHEEGHRSVLTKEGIGSISKPYFDSDGVARVVGVRDEDLKGLRDTELPTFIRLHTAGLESDAALLNRAETLCAFNQEHLDVLWIEYVIRRLNQVLYYASSLFEYEVGIEEEANELDRDIVGHDVYGAIRHLHRPTMDFSRYTDYDDLTSEERDFADRVGLRSLVNLVNPLLVRRPNWNLRPNIKWSFGLGYSMCPFGDYLEQNVWFLIRERTRLHCYVREFENQDDWFLGMGLRLVDCAVSDRLTCSIGVHVWDQPKDLSFVESIGEVGGAVDVLLRYRIFTRCGDGRRRSASVDIGVVSKTPGFLPEEAFLDGRTSLRLGFSLAL
ncbi:MAG: hypothetical protein HQ559_07510 [Lentisphaerae bacterium]|nr:hypothetical protein [Lentisphaerota bacterium]